MGNLLHWIIGSSLSNIGTACKGDFDSTRELIYLFIYKDFWILTKLCSPESFDFKYSSKGHGKEE